MLDVVCSELPGEAARVHADVSVRAGGSAVNAAQAAVSVGASASVIGRIGTDPAGELILRELAAHGVTPNVAMDPDVPTGAAVAFPGPSVVATRGANARFSVRDVPRTIDADALFVSGFALFQSGSADAATEAVNRFIGSWVGVDVGSPMLASAARDLDLGFARNTVILVTSEEARAMTAAEPEEAARALASRFSLACVKLGEDGAIAVAGDEVERRSAVPVIRRSPFGAGDAFGGALLVALAAGDPLGLALQQACDEGGRAAAR